MYSSVPPPLAAPRYRNNSADMAEADSRIRSVIRVGNGRTDQI